MTLCIDSGDHFHNDQGAKFALTCPHCQVLAHMTAVSVPSYAALQTYRPSHVGLVYRCDSCNAPVFLKFAVKLYASSRVDLSSDYTELERAPESFAYFTYLPEEPEQLFREALICFSAGANNAFASLCRRTAQSVFADLGDNGRLSMFDELNEIRDFTGLDSDTFNAVRKVLFGNDSEPRPNMPPIDNYLAGVLLEVMKDLLYEAYVRRGQLTQALVVRRHSTEDARATLTSLPRADLA